MRIDVRVLDNGGQLANGFILDADVVEILASLAAQANASVQSTLQAAIVYYALRARNAS